MVKEPLPPPPPRVRGDPLPVALPDRSGAPALHAPSGPSTACSASIRSTSSGYYPLLIRRQLIVLLHDPLNLGGDRLSYHSVQPREIAAEQPIETDVIIFGKIQKLVSRIAQNFRQILLGNLPLIRQADVHFRVCTSRPCVTVQAASYGAPLDGELRCVCESTQAL
jgi:hypothetical protein